MEMENCSKVSMANSLHKYCVLWFAIEVVTVGVETFIRSWNSHPIPGKVTLMYQLKVLLYTCVYNKGRRRGGMRIHIPNEVMQRNNRITRIDQRHLPSSQAVRMYREEQGRLSDESYFR